MSNTRNFLFISFVFLVFFSTFSVSFVKAEQYYADITINVDNSGFVTISGNTNHPDLIVENTEFYTSKKQSNWILNITINDVFSNYNYFLKLPKGASINSFNSSDNYRIYESQGSLIVEGFGENKPFSLIVYYQITKNSETDTLSFDRNILLVFEIIIIILIILLSISVFQNRRKKLVYPVETTTIKDENYSFRGLTDRQKQIMQFLIDQNRAVTQVEIQNELNIPKAAVSRNVHALEIKDLVEIEKVGMSNLVRLKKQ